MSLDEVKKCRKCDEEMEIGYLPGAFSWSAGTSLWSLKNPLKIFGTDAKAVVMSNSTPRKSARPN